MAQYLKGRGALSNPANRFAATKVAAVEDGWSPQEVPDSIATQVRPERARTLITTNQSPDIPFEQSINPYRGCEHGCPYCYAAPAMRTWISRRAWISRPTFSTRQTRQLCCARS